MATMKLGSKEDIFQLEDQTWDRNIVENVIYQNKEKHRHLMVVILVPTIISKRRCMTELASDVVIEVGEMSFRLHKFPLLNRSGLLRKMISEFRSEDGQGCVLQLHDVPGGAKAFELVAKFCYDVKIELNSLNVVCLRCAAEYLRMTEDYVGGNLIMQTENFLTEMFGSWKDSIKALEACERVLPHAEDLHIVSRCINSLASKACADPSLSAWPEGALSSMKSPESGLLWNGIGPEEPRDSAVSDWWYEDASYLSLPLFKRLIMAMEAKGMKPESTGGALMHYARRFLPGLTRNSSFRDGNAHIPPTGSVSAPSETDQKVFLEDIVELLPAKKGVATTKFLLRMLHTAMMLHASPSCRENLERRVGAQLDEATLEDLLIPNLGYSVETLYDVDCMQRILDYFMLTNQAGVAFSPGIIDEGQLASSPFLAPMTMVAKLVDGYLAEVAPDVNLKLPKFQALAALIPDYARTLDDGMYRAIDIYLKTHPWLTESEREQLCRLMNCQKLSLEACTHAAQNERLPLRHVVQVLFFEQLRLRTSMAGWLFVTDNMEHSNAPTGNLMQPRNSDSAVQEEVTQDPKEDDQCLSANDMRLKVLELEKECSSMRQEMRKLGKPKSSWNIFTRKCSFGVKSQGVARTK